MKKLAGLLCVLALGCDMRGFFFGREGRFRLTDGDQWGGQTLSASRVILCSPNAPTALKVMVKIPKEGQVVYGSLVVGGSELTESLGVVLVREGSGATRVYLDGNGDGVVSEREGATLRPNAVAWARCRGKLSAGVNVRVPFPEGGWRVWVARTLAVWLGDAPNVLFFAFQGFLQGEVEIDGVQRAAFLADGNANGTFQDDGLDQLWIDLNGDEKLDFASEAFPVAPILRIAKQTYNFSVKPVRHEVRLRRVEGGLGKARLAFQPRPDTSVAAVMATLVSRAGDVVWARMGQEFEVPAGNYYVSSLTLQLTDKTNEQWAYSFSHSVKSLAEKEFPLRVQKDGVTDVVPLSSVKLGMEVEGEKNPGGALRVSLSAKSDLGAVLTNAVRGEQSRGSYEDFARIELLSPEGAPLATASSGFA